MNQRRARASDAQPITSPEEIEEMWKTWETSWMASKNDGSFNEHIRKSYGSKFFVLALFQKGLSWVPTAPPSAPQEDVADWLVELLKAIHEQKNECKEDNVNPS